ncbi:MAG: M1 family metallopeptidase [Melioribacteraceae bacterium]|nr:M1 family metallopeptidase [Melioribacteraceae bacterium]
MKKNNLIFLFISFIISGFIFGLSYLYQQISEKYFYTFNQDPITFISDLKNYEDEVLEYYNPSFQEKLDVLFYDIDINIIPKEKIIDSKVSILIKLKDNKIKFIPLNFYNNLLIKSIKINNEEVSYKREEKLIYLFLDKSLDTAKVEIIYSGTPKNVGFGSFTFSEKENYPFIYTMNEPIFASTWLPCIDRPDDKAQMKIKITNDSSLTSLSNGKLISIEKKGDKKTFVWKTYYPISTYLISIYSGKYISKEEEVNSKSNDKIKLIYYLFPSDYENGIKDFSDHPNYINTFENLFGPYPFSKEKYSVAEFLWQNGAMEHQTITGIGSSFINGRKLFSDMLIHELAHHWWGNAVTLKSWKDIWLNEGFATYSEALYWEKESGSDALKTTMLSKFSEFKSGTLYNPIKDLFSRLVYDKGAWVLHMLRKEIGDNNFFSSLKKYFETYKYSNASTKDFQNICEKISGKDLKYFFEQWVYYGTGIIDIAYDWNYDVDNKELVINIEQKQKGYEIYKFHLDLLIEYQTKNSEVFNFYIDKKNSRIKINLDEKPINIIFDPNKWLLAKYESRNDE